MTVHIAASLPDASAAVIFSDSQASTSTDESHGAQKLYAGEDYLVGCAGSGAIIYRLFEKLHEEAALNAAGLMPFIEQFLQDEINPRARETIEILTLTPSGGPEPAIRQFMPSHFLHFGSRATFSSIGSGASFVFRAIKRDGKNGIPFFLDSIVDLMLAADNLAEAATESLTVDDLHLVGILRNGRTYVLGHRDIVRTFFAPALSTVAAWTLVSQGLEEVVAIVDTIKAEVTNGQRTVSNMRKGAITAHDLHLLQNSNQAIAQSRAALDARINAYCGWYDALLAR